MIHPGDISIFDTEFGGIPCYFESMLSCFVPSWCPFSSRCLREGTEATKVHHLGSSLLSQKASRLLSEKGWCPEGSRYLSKDLWLGPVGGDRLV